MKRKKIVLSGVGTVNKGSELRIYAILQEIERKFPDAIVYISAPYNPQGLSYIKTKLQLKNKTIDKWRRQYKRFHIQGIAKLLHINKVHLDDVYAIKDTDYFIDSSGFLVTDQWSQNEYSIKNGVYFLKGIKI